MIYYMHSLMYSSNTECYATLDKELLFFYTGNTLTTRERREPILRVMSRHHLLEKQLQNWWGGVRNSYIMYIVTSEGQL